MTEKTYQNKVDVLGIGDAMVDLTTQASQLPPKGGNIWSTAVRLSPGGTTANVSANAARLGVRSGFMGCVGDDPYGQYIISDFEKSGVDVSLTIKRQESYTGIVLAIIDDEGERTFICCGKGAAHTQFFPKDLQNVDFSSFPVVHTSGVCLVEEPSRSAILTSLEQSHQAGCLVYYDPNLRLEGNIFPAELREAQMKAIALSDVVLIGDEEVQRLYERKSFKEGVQLLLRAGPKVVVVKQGEQGATLFSERGVDHCPAFKVPVVSTAGAGDSFDAGFIAARHRGSDLHEALVYACAVAAIKVTRHGSRSVPDHEEVLTFLEEYNSQI